ncbi:SANT/Myb domain - like 10 [Theobroma cacao]|nr:SANT/Myb domain - like 10 [Theobroma cacao]
MGKGLYATAIIATKTSASSVLCVLIWTNDNLSFPLICPDWNADDEILLPEGIEMCGLGIWAKVVEHVGTKTKEKCIEHYDNVYMKSPYVPLARMCVMLLEKTEESFLQWLKGVVRTRKVSVNFQVLYAWGAYSERRIFFSPPRVNKFASLTAEVNEVQEALKSSIAKLLASVTGHLAKVLEVAKKVATNMERKKLHTETNVEYGNKDKEEDVPATSVNPTQAKRVEGHSRKGKKLRRAITKVKLPSIRMEYLRMPLLALMRYGKHWKQILRTFPFVFVNRIAGDLKDKWKNINGE